MSNPQILRLRRATRFFYDQQKLRIQFGNRNAKRDDGTSAILDDQDKAFLEKQSEGLHELEKSTLKEVERLLKPIPIYKWLKAQKGCGPTMAGVIISEIDISKAHTVSALWKYCGLSCEGGVADRPKRGQKLTYNPFVKTKLVGVLGSCMIKANSPWRSFYDNYKTRKKNTQVPVCMQCDGKGKCAALEETETDERADVGEQPESTERAKSKNGTTRSKRAETKEETRGTERAASEDSSTDTKRAAPKLRKCPNCNGTGGPAPWGKSDKHRHAAANRYMIKMFIQALWLEWRTLEGLEVNAPYAEAYLGRKHGDHGGSLSAGL